MADRQTASDGREKAAEEEENEGLLKSFALNNLVCKRYAK